MTIANSTKGAPRILIRGAGIIGLSIAWTLKKRGIEPFISDEGSLQRQASRAAAGMLSAQFERYVDPSFSAGVADFADYSAKLWLEFSRMLEKESGIALYYQSGPSFGFVDVEPHQNNSVNECSTTDITKLVGEIGQTGASEKLRCFPQDGQVDNRAVMDALAVLCRGNFTRFDSDEVDFDIVIECRGWQAEQSFPVKGQMLSLAPRPWHPKIPVRWGEHYVAPKHDRTIIGATVEPGESGGDILDNDIKRLLSEAIQRLPSLGRDCEVLDKWSGIRPRSKQRKPVMKWQENGRNYIATGHYRNGILLAPASAEYVVSDIFGEKFCGPDL